MNDEICNREVGREDTAAATRCAGSENRYLDAALSTERFFYNRNQPTNSQTHVSSILTEIGSRESHEETAKYEYRHAYAS